MLNRERKVISKHDLIRCAGVVRYALLRSSGLPEVCEIRGGVDRIVSQKFDKIPLPPPIVGGREWSG